MYTLIRYGELALKSKPVRELFEKRLANNIKNSLKNNSISSEVKRRYGRIVIRTRQNPERVLKKVFGIVSFSHCLMTPSDFKRIERFALSVMKKQKAKTFALKTTRVGFHEFTSQDINEEIGTLIVKKLGLKVNLSEPDVTLYIEVRDNETYLYTEKIPGPGGMPTGSQGKIMSIIDCDKGMESSIAMMKRGCIIIPVFAGVKPKTYLKKLSQWHSGYKIKYYSSKGSIKDAVANANGFAAREGAKGIATSLTLKDSDKFQDLKNVSRLPVFYPLIGE